MSGASSPMQGDAALPYAPLASTSAPHSLRTPSTTALGFDDAQTTMQGAAQARPSKAGEPVDEKPSRSAISPATAEADAAMSNAAEAGSVAKGKQTKKRGRKRLDEDLDNLKDNDQLDTEAKRKLQNRAAQRAFRERRERHVADLEEKVSQQESELARCRNVIALLRQENEALRRGQNPPSVVSNDTPYSESSAAPAQTPPSPNPVHHPPQRPPNMPSRSFIHILNDADAPPTARQGFSSAVDGASFSFPSAAPPSLLASSPPSLDPSMPLPPPLPLSNVEIDTSQPFDFDAPFDFSESMALPPLFVSMLDEIALPPPPDPSAPPSFVAAIAAGSRRPDLPECGCAEDQANSNDVGPDLESLNDDDPPALPNGRIPCDKPECDFTAVSCALPIPWRPPNALGLDKDLWIAQKCWAKLVSHPLFDRCDPDDLCQELRDKTRCSDDGRLVCHKDDVCSIFRNIPRKAQLRQMQSDMQ
ncbi:hypothetical protein JCM10212_004887 [Sporobolomyces blumeae]